MVRIEVTQDCIDAGTPRKLKECPVALALFKECGPRGEIYVYPDHINTWGMMERNHYRFDLPLKVQDFISFFDAGLPVEPIEFELEEAK